MVRRNSTWKTPPRQSLTVSCPVIHCGETLEVTWCKLFDSVNCERIHETKNVKITQNPDKDKLISYLNFKEISIHDDGMYRCGLLGYNGSVISHSIIISVSGMLSDIFYSSSALKYKIIKYEVLILSTMYHSLKTCTRELKPPIIMIKMQVRSFICQKITANIFVDAV